MHKPNYRDGSIVNLISSIQKSFGVKGMYNPLKNFDITSLKNKNVVLIVIDGLGYEYLKKYGKNSFLAKNLKQKITSVFPSTTASAFTSLTTGVAPQQHGLTGWFMYEKEIKNIVAPLPGLVFDTQLKLVNKKIDYSKIHNIKGFLSNLDAHVTHITHKDYIDSDYSNLIHQDANKLNYNGIDNFFDQIKKSLLKNKKRQFILAYWPEFDALSHDYGTDGKVVKKHFDKLDKKICDLEKFVKDKNTSLIITADHGQINSDDSKMIDLMDYKDIAEAMLVASTGEPRAAYFHIKKNKKVQFENCVKNKLGKYCEIYKSTDLIKMNFFGFSEPHKKLVSRVGDYVLIMKDNFVIKNHFVSEKPPIGHHGGLSKEEMYVPLIVIK